MAVFQFDYNDQLEEMIKNLDRFDEIAPKLIEASVPILKKCNCRMPKT